MLVLLSCAKTMSEGSGANQPSVSVPRFADRARELALYMSQYPVDELERLLRINARIAVGNYKRFQEFHSADVPALAAVLSYTGIVFKKLDPASFTSADLQYSQDHLRLTSFLYGLLRPLDGIRPYRLEGDVRLPELGGGTLFDYWKPILTDTFIEDVKQAGGILCNLASDEMKGLFNWPQVQKELRIVTPEFKTVKNGKLKTIVVYTKMCRGEMARYILRNRITDPEKLKAFEWEGFEYNETLSDEHNLVFTN